MIFPIDIKTIQEIEKSLPNLPKGRATAIKSKLREIGNSFIKDIVKEIINTDKNLSKSEQDKLLKSLPNILKIESLNGKYNIIPDFTKALDGKKDTTANIIRKAFKKLSPVKFNDYLEQYFKSATTNYEDSMFSAKKANPDDILEKLNKNRGLADNSFSTAYPQTVVIPKKDSVKFRDEMEKAGFTYRFDFTLEHKNDDSDDYGLSKSTFNNQKAKNIIKRYNTNLEDKSMTLQEYRKLAKNVKLHPNSMTVNELANENYYFPAYPPEGKKAVIVKVFDKDMKYFKYGTNMLDKNDKRKDFIRTHKTGFDVYFQVVKEVVFKPSYYKKANKDKSNLSDCKDFDCGTTQNANMSDKPKRKYSRRKKSNLSEQVSNVPGTNLSDGGNFISNIFKNDPLVKFIKKAF